MAEEEVSVAAAAESPVQLSDHEKKRKLEDVEANPPESLTCVDLVWKVDQEKEQNAEETFVSEAKRPCLEDSEDENGHLDTDASGNGYQEKDGVHKLGETKEDKVDQQPLAVENVLDDDGQQKTSEAPTSAEVEQQDSGDPQSGDNEQIIGENEEPKTVNEENDTKGDVQEPTTVNEENDTEGNVQEPIADVSQDGDGSNVELRSETVSHKMEVPNNKVGVLIGKAGDTIRYLQYNSGAKIQITRDADADPHLATRPVELIGTLESIEKAKKLINDVIAEADAGGSPSLVARGFSTVQAVVGDQVEIQVPNEKVGLIIGKGGETIKNLQTRSGARIQLVPQHLPAGDQSKERTVRVTGDKKQIEIAREMITEVLNQLVRPSPHSGGYSQESFRPRGPGPVARQWASRGPQATQLMGHGYQQRGPYPSQNQQYPPASYGNYPPRLPPRSSSGPSWEQRPPLSMQGPPLQVGGYNFKSNYNYVQPQHADYGQPNPFPQTSVQSYGEGYNTVKYENQMASQHPHSGHGVSQPTLLPQGGGTHPGYGPRDQYGQPASYGMYTQAPHGQAYGQPRPSQPGDVFYQAPVSSTPAYGSNMPPQQPYSYTSSGSMQQNYPPYGSGPTTEGYHRPPPPTASGPVDHQQAVQPVSAYGLPAGQQPPVYSTGGLAGGYGSYPSQPGYTEQPAASNAGYIYQTSADAAYGSGSASATYGAPSALQPGYVQPATTQPGYDQSNPPPGGYGTAAVPAQYDSSQMYAAPRG